MKFIGILSIAIILAVKSVSTAFDETSISEDSEKYEIITPPSTKNVPETKASEVDNVPNRAVETIIADGNGNNMSRFVETKNNLKDDPMDKPTLIKVTEEDTATTDNSQPATGAKKISATTNTEANESSKKQEISSASSGNDSSQEPNIEVKSGKEPCSTFSFLDILMLNVGIMAITIIIAYCFYYFKSRKLSSTSCVKPNKDSCTGSASAVNVISTVELVHERPQIAISSNDPSFYPKLKSYNYNK